MGRVSSKTKQLDQLKFWARYGKWRAEETPLSHSMVTSMSDKEAEVRRLSAHSRRDLPRIKVVSPYSASWTHEQEDDDGSH